MGHTWTYLKVPLYTLISEITCVNLSQVSIVPKYPCQRWSSQYSIVLKFYCRGANLPIHTNSEHFILSSYVDWLWRSRARKVGCGRSKFVTAASRMPSSSKTAIIYKYNLPCCHELDFKLCPQTNHKMINVHFWYPITSILIHFFCWIIHSFLAVNPRGYSTTIILPVHQ